MHGISKIPLLCWESRSFLPSDGRFIFLIRFATAAAVADAAGACSKKRVSNAVAAHTDSICGFTVTITAMMGRKRNGCDRAIKTDRTD